MKGLDTKYRFSPFSIYDYRFVEEYFAAMAAKGWMIESIGGFLWRFKKTEPSEKTFAAFSRPTLRTISPYLSKATRFSKSFA